MNVTLVDTHVHFHGCFSPPAFLEAAADNLRRARAHLGVHDARGLLVITEIGPGGPLRRLFESRRELPKAWNISGREDAGFAVCRRGDEPALAMVAGRQLATREGLELLALGTTATFLGNRSLVDAVADVRRSGGIAVLPWGFGKWWFARGLRVRAFLKACRGEIVFLGDNGNRPNGWIAPRAFACAARRGILTLAGSDPLAFEAHVSRVASYGSMVPGVVDLRDPTGWLRTSLRSLRDSPRSFGQTSNVRQFVSDQVRMRLARKRGPSADDSPRTRPILHRTV